MGPRKKKRKKIERKEREREKKRRGWKGEKDGSRWWSLQPVSNGRLST
jgi:hypothetical protein